MKHALILSSLAFPLYVDVSVSYAFKLVPQCGQKNTRMIFQKHRYVFPETTTD